MFAVASAFGDTMKRSQAPWTVWLRFTHQRPAVRYRTSAKRLTAYGEPVNETPFGRYRLIELLGRGGMGEVWRAHDTETRRSVAIKVLPPHLADDGEFVQRFRREAEAARPN